MADVAPEENAATIRWASDSNHGALRTVVATQENELQPATMRSAHAETMNRLNIIGLSLSQNGLSQNGYGVFVVVVCCYCVLLLCVVIVFFLRRKWMRKVSQVHPTTLQQGGQPNLD